MADARETDGPAMKEFAALLESASSLDARLRTIPDIPIPQRLMEQILGLVHELGWELGVDAGSEAAGDTETGVR